MNTEMDVEASEALEKEVDICSICMCTATATKSLSLVPCGHRIHQPCFIKYIKSFDRWKYIGNADPVKIEPHCPICRIGLMHDTFDTLREKIIDVIERIQCLQSFCSKSELSAFVEGVLVALQWREKCYANDRESVYIHQLRKDIQLYKQLHNYILCMHKCREYMEMSVVSLRTFRQQIQPICEHDWESIKNTVVCKYCLLIQSDAFAQSPNSAEPMYMKDYLNTNQKHCIVQEVKQY